MGDPLYRTRNELDAARRAIKQMKSARSFQEFETAWQDFLGRLERAWNKSERAFSDGAYASWRGQHENRRKTDQLLHYLKQARDAEEHTLGETVAREPGAIGINPASGTSLYVEEMKIERGIVTIKGAHPGIAITVFPERARLLPALNRGVITKPPTEHLGNPLGRTDPVSVAEVGLEYYEQFVGEARTKFGNKRYKHNT